MRGVVHHYRTFLYCFLRIMSWSTQLFKFQWRWSSTFLFIFKICLFSSVIKRLTCWEWHPCPKVFQGYLNACHWFRSKSLLLFYIPNSFESFIISFFLILMHTYLKTLYSFFTYQLWRRLHYVFMILKHNILRSMELWCMCVVNSTLEFQLAYHKLRFQ